MHIKQIIIQGFKSYKDQTVIEPFSPKHNVIVGRNGSGKSNFFAAIRFVLSDAYTQMGKEERQALLHEGTGPAVMSAFVEIIFDNSDDRFPTGKPEVTLRRTIGIKKDEYTLDKKNATKSDVMNLLESAGFSRSNPYYIVPQGRVTALTNMKDSERLTLLKEVAGTQVYEARRTESLKIMTDTLNRRAKIDELLDYINERLRELEEEKEELRDYQEKDKERRCLQYTIDHREQSAIEGELSHLDEQRATGVDDTEDSRRRFVDNEEALAAITEQVNNFRQQMELAKLDKAQLESDRRDLVRERAGVDLQLQSLDSSRAAAEETKAQLQHQLSSVRGMVQQREGALNHIMPAFMSEMEKENQLKTELARAETMRQRLVAKQGRMDRFKSKQERDAALRREIEEVRPQFTQLKSVRKQTTENLSQIEQQIAATEKTIEGLRTQIEQRGSNRESLLEQEQAFKAEEARLNDERKELWREDAKLNSTLGKARDQLNQSERNLSHRMDNNTSRGLAAIARYKRQHKMDGVYGYVAELLQTDKDTYHTAIEVAAGQSLFHYVVDHDETANKLMSMLEQDRAGRITFMPLNRLKPRPSNVPKAADAVPLMDKLRFEAKYEKAFQQVFGRAVVCPNITIAAQYARSHNVDAITLDGDRSDRRGALTGGYIDKRKSRMDAVRSVIRWRAEAESQRTRLDEIGRELGRKDQEITQAHGGLVKLGQSRAKHDSGYDGVKAELARARQRLQRLQDDLEGQQAAVREQDASMKSLADTQANLEAEVASEFKKALTEAEEAQLQGLVAAIQRQRPQLNAASRSRGELEAQKSALEMELRENLRPRLEQLVSQEMDAADSGSGGNAVAVQKELRRLDRAVGRLEAQLAELEAQLEAAGGSIGGQEARGAEIRAEQEEIARSIERAQKRMEKNMQKKSLLQKQAAEVGARIRDLGALPADFARYDRIKSDAAVKRLHKVNEALKKYGHVNKKAFQQYEQFTTQRETLTRRREELDANQRSITELISHLDQRKDEAIERTFKQVSREFAAVFEALVPAGRGRLIIQRRLDRRGDDDDSADDDAAAAAGNGVESYTGVGIAVSFNSKHDDQQRIQQLSGGQKSLCALTLIFAIQRCDPAPFYLFDEIDANLDAQYRTAVAQMLQAISSGDGDGQFICTTFRPEMLLVAQKCYGVTYEKKSSKVLCVSRDDAMEFVQGEATK